MEVRLTNCFNFYRSSFVGQRRFAFVAHNLTTLTTIFLAFSTAGVDAQPVPGSSPVPTARPIVFTDVSAELSAQIIQGVIETVQKGSQKEPETVLKVTDKQGDTTRYTLSNPQDLPQFSTSFPLHLELVPKKKYNVEIKAVSIKSVGRWRLENKQVVDFRKMPQLKQLDSSIEELGDVVVPNLKGRIDDQNISVVMNKYKEARKHLETLYPTVKNDRQVLAAMIELKRHLETEQRIFFHNKLISENADGSAHQYLKEASLVEKRFFRLNDNYRPEIYDMIKRQCSTSVAIVRIGTDNPLGSGVLIGNRLVLTCRHNIRENTAKSYETSEYLVWFNFEERRWPPEIKTVAYDCREIYRSKKLDFSLLEIKPLQQPMDPEPAPIPISTARVERWTPIFLVGYPQGTRRTVHDGAWVLFPHKLMSNQERGELEAEIAEDFVDWTAAGEVTDKTEWALLQAQEFTEDCYGARKNGSEVEYSYMKGDQPSIGAECDTFKGDSGAPAILRDSGGLIGILYKGLDDIPGQSAALSGRKPTISGKASAKYHELLLPISVIVQELDSSYPAWKDYGIQFEGEGRPSPVPIAADTP